MAFIAIRIMEENKYIPMDECGEENLGRPERNEANEDGGSQGA